MQKYTCEDARYSLLSLAAAIIYTTTGGPPIEKREFAVPPDTPDNNPALNVGTTFMLLLKKIKYKLRSTRKTPSIFFMVASASPLQKHMMAVIVETQPIISGIIIRILAYLYIFARIMTHMMSDVTVESTNESEYEWKKCGITDIMNTPDPNPQSVWIIAAKKHVKAKSIILNNF